MFCNLDKYIVIWYQSGSAQRQRYEDLLATLTYCAHLWVGPKKGGGDKSESGGAFREERCSPRYFSRWIIVLPCLTTVTDISMTGRLKMAKQNWTKYREPCGKIKNPMSLVLKSSYVISFTMWPKLATLVEPIKHRSTFMSHTDRPPTWSRDSWRWIYAAFFATTACLPSKCIYADWAVVGKMYCCPVSNVLRLQMYYSLVSNVLHNTNVLLRASRSKWITCSGTPC